MKRVLFVCLGNSCRSQMAEGFARAYGGDVMRVESAGLAPAGIIVPPTLAAMEEKNLSLEGQFPKGLQVFRPEDFEIVVNMSGLLLPPAWRERAEIWHVRDPIGQSAEVYRAVRDEIETRVMRLILALRRENA